MVLPTLAGLSLWDCLALANFQESALYRYAALMVLLTLRVLRPLDVTGNGGFEPLRHSLPLYRRHDFAYHREDFLIRKGVSAINYDGLYSPSIDTNIIPHHLSYVK